MDGLFSSSEQDMLSNIVQQRQQANQALASPYGKYGGIVQAGAQMADIGADAMFGGKTGASDPRMQQMNEVKNIFSQVAIEVGNTSSADFYDKLSKELSAKYPDQAQKASEKAAQLKETKFKEENRTREMKETIEVFDPYTEKMQPRTYTWTEIYDPTQKKWVKASMSKDTSSNTSKDTQKSEPSKTPFLTQEQIEAERKRREEAKRKAAAAASTYGMPPSGYVAP